MKSAALLLFLATILSLVLTGCAPSPSPAAPTAMPPTPTITPIPKGKTIVVTSAADSGPGTLRQALLEAQPGDTITFDPAIFPPNAPVTILLKDGLPEISQGYLTIDASDAGVILDGSHVEGSTTDGLHITSNGNTIQGLQILNFPANGITLDNGASRNIIGGDRSVGSGPLGQGNLLSNNEEAGIGLFRPGTSYNVIVGNYIGTGLNGADPWGNQWAGIIIKWCSDNVIGPDNIIAYNHINGIEITYEESYRNTITRNRICENDGTGISLLYGSNFELTAPSILEFDLTMGTIAGITCSNCIVEIFSDSDDEGGIYEGQTSADGNGMFAFNKGSAFTGPHLMATATNEEGNTSGFSLATWGGASTLTLQKDNNLIATLLKTKESKDLEDNRIGFMLRPDENTRIWGDSDAYVQEIARMGLKHVRLSIDYFDLEMVNWGSTYSTYSIEPDHDKTINNLIDNNIKIRYCIIFWDHESPGQSLTPGYFRFKSEDEIQRYLDYTRFIVSHFKGRVEYYEILNEPVSGSGTQQSVEVEDYIQLVRRVVPVIRQEDPKAKITVGAIPNLYEPQDYEYLMRLLISEIMPIVDAISFHPMHGVSPDYEHREDYYKYPSVIQEIKDIASSHGFNGDYMADELVWRTSANPVPSEPWIYTEIAAAKYYVRGIIVQLGLDLFAGTTELDLANLHSHTRPIGKVIQNLANIMAGAAPESLPVEIQSEATNITNYSFSLPNGDKLLALWTDGVAVDEDPGVLATLTFPGFSAQTVVGIDVLYGVEQQLMTESVDGNLVIRDLLVKDYPIILRLSP